MKKSSIYMTLSARMGPKCHEEKGKYAEFTCSCCARIAIKYVKLCYLSQKECLDCGRYDFCQLKKDK